MQIFPGEKIFLLALFYHLLTIYFGVGDYVYQTALLHVCFLHNPAHCVGLEVLILTKTITPNRSTRGP